jgi:hypothetical protein
MSGSIEEIPLPDLLQLLSTSKKSGVIVIRGDAGVGKVYLRKGQIYFASIDDSFKMGPRKAIIRMLSWQAGFFDLEPPDERAVLEELQDSTEGLLMEGMRQLDEYQVISRSCRPCPPASRSRGRSSRSSAISRPRSSTSSGRPHGRHAARALRRVPADGL